MNRKFFQNIIKFFLPSCSFERGFCSSNSSSKIGIELLIG
ncbi:13030_t:CDS:2 [Cetraspora pellucida]|uniref:13030_t:CDS:1 n=1 Tax=Cetraspora pellucida TaxID=1433469 RepID=A0A9N8Z2P1_9GLOM|nr:13030_t:CDS:2 [Cetraspora pellucida]